MTGHDGTLRRGFRGVQVKIGVEVSGVYNEPEDENLISTSVYSERPKVHHDSGIRVSYVLSTSEPLKVDLKSPTRTFEPTGSSANGVPPRGTVSHLGVASLTKFSHGSFFSHWVIPTRGDPVTDDLVTLTPVTRHPGSYHLGHR